MPLTHPDTTSSTTKTTTGGHESARPCTRQEILTLLEMPFNDLIFRAQQVHRLHFDPNEVQLSTLLSIKTGGCVEDCKYCPQSSQYDTGLQGEPLLQMDAVLKAARAAKASGATRFCMGAAWRNPKGAAFERVTELISEVSALGMETCATLGMLEKEQAVALKEAGLDYYNHNLDTAPEFYEEIITTRTYDDRLETLRNVREAELSVCCGGIVGMGETREHRAGLLSELAQLDPYPESVPINLLIKVEGTPMENTPDLDLFEFVRTIAAARIAMPTTLVRLSAGREDMSDEMQALCFLAGANSIFYGEKLLTTGNQEANHDQRLFARLGLRPAES